MLSRFAALKFWVHLRFFFYSVYARLPTWDGWVVMGFRGAFASLSTIWFILVSTTSEMSCLSSDWCSPTRGMDEPTTCITLIGYVIHIFHVDKAEPLCPHERCYNVADNLKHFIRSNNNNNSILQGIWLKTWEIYLKDLWTLEAPWHLVHV